MYVHVQESSNGNKTPTSPGYIPSNWQNMVVQAPQTYNHGKYDNTEKVWYLLFDDDDKTSYKYIFSISETWLVQINTYNTYIAKMTKKVIEKTIYILDTLSIEYTVKSI